MEYDIHSKLSLTSLWKTEDIFGEILFHNNILCKNTEVYLYT